MLDAAAPSSTTAAGRYPASSRLLHWITAAAILVQVPVGIWMARRGAADIWDALTNALYSWHKLIGFTLLWIVLIRVFLVARGAWPPYPPSLPKPQQGAAHAVHGLLYLGLLTLVLTGWAGVTAYPALVTVGGYNLPAMPFVPQSSALAGTLFTIHKFAAYGLLFLLVGHIGAAMLHLVVFKDGIFQRMSGR
jgi:cytochrome b561